MEDYEFDVFLSYKRHAKTLIWVEKVCEILDYWLTQELGGKPPKIFFDKNTIETGSNWPTELRMGVRKSRCMVGIWTPEYFSSKWCVAEWQSFYQRQKLLKKHNHRVILPMRFHDGEHYPDDARNIQSLDVSDYTSTLPAFWESEKAVELENLLLRPLCCQIAVSVKNSPAYNPSWPTPNPEPEPSERPGLMRL